MQQIAPQTVSPRAYWQATDVSGFEAVVVAAAPVKELIVMVSTIKSVWVVKVVKYSQPAAVVAVRHSAMVRELVKHVCPAEQQYISSKPQNVSHPLSIR